MCDDALHAGIYRLARAGYLRLPPFSLRGSPHPGPHSLALARAHAEGRLAPPPTGCTAHAPDGVESMGSGDPVCIRLGQTLRADLGEDVGLWCVCAAADLLRVQGADARERRQLLGVLFRVSDAVIESACARAPFGRLAESVRDDDIEAVLAGARATRRARAARP